MSLRDGSVDSLSSTGGSFWATPDAPHLDVVISSRARLARNLAGAPFMPRADRTARVGLLDRIRAALAEPEVLGGDCVWIPLHSAEAFDHQVLVERHLISQNHAAGKLSNGEGGPDEPRAVAIRLPDETASVMVNEEDHLRIQAFGAGLAIEPLYQIVSEIDDLLEARLDYAYSQRFGYVTACPTNVGTGARFSAMLHLPALRLIGDIEKVKRAASDMSLAVRGYYGEGSGTTADYYQISNQTTLGKSESVLIHELEREILPKIVAYERNARQKLFSRKNSVIDDKVHRALGTLLHARVLSAEESMQLLGLVRLGVFAGSVAGLGASVISRLMLLSQPGHLQRAVGRPIDQEQRRIERARVVRETLATALGYREQ